MSENGSAERTDGPGGERYSIGDERAQQEYVGVRRAAKWVPFFLPHLKPGMRLLDCGCGVGSITVDLAEVVDPGQVIGIDRDPGQLAAARALAQRQHVTNVDFEVGDVYDLGYPDASFDAVLAHTLLMHLSDPLKALRVMRRVLKPGGVIGVADDDYSTIVHSPADSGLEQIIDLWTRFLLHNGASPYYSRHLRGLLLEVGFARTEGHAMAVDYHGTLEETRHMAALFGRLMQETTFVETVVDQGWASRSQLQELVAALRAWGERPDAFLALMYCAAVGWADEDA